MKSGSARVYPGWLGLLWLATALTCATPAFSADSVEDRAGTETREAVEDANARNFTTTHRYDALGRRILTTLPDDSEISYTYDPAGNRTSETNARGFTTTYDYDGLNRRKSQVDPTEIGTSQTWQYDVANKVLVHTDRRGIVARTNDDGENRRARFVATTSFEIQRLD